MAIINKHILLAASAIVLAACGNDADPESSQRSDAKTAIPVTIGLVDAGARTQTRAADHDFAGGDKLVAHLRHVVKADDGNYSAVDQLNKTPVFTVSSNPSMTLVDGTTATYQTQDITSDEALYWDDFSSATQDIRTDGHGLQVEWGYCFNGNTGAPGSGYTDRLSSRSVATDQTAGYQTSDLLWAKTQEMVKYEHKTSADDDSRNGLVIPYTHAMSKATVILQAADGFESDAGVFANTTVTLANVNVQGTFTASTATVTEATPGAGIQMHKVGVSADGKTVTFDCVFVPTRLTVGQTFATVSNAGGNNYTIPVTATMLASNSWNCSGQATQSGVNYQLTATLRKAKIEVKAQITDWVTNTATGDGEIQFSTDLTNVNPSTDLTEGTSYDIYRGTATTDLAYATTRNYADSKWANTPEIYWANASTDYYFRGLAKLDGGKITSVNQSVEAANDVDLLWATTPKHTGTAVDGTEKTVDEGEAISPRTSHVPLEFRHAMSRVTFKLATTTGDDAVGLEGAKITVPDLYTTGTIDVATGKITTTGTASALETLSATSHIVIPQNVKDKKVTITLADGTTYTVILGDYEAWEGGNDYTYTITLKKESISLRALIREWNKQEGSGDATLDWD